MAKNRFRAPKYYDGTHLTSQCMADLLPHVLIKMGESLRVRGDLVLAAWPDLIGPKLAVMTEAISFVDGILVVRVKNSTLHSLLSQNEKPRLLLLLRKKFPHTEIKNIHFRIG